MLVVKIYMWPLGDQGKERLLAQGTLECIGVAKRDDPAVGVVEGERAYRVRLLKSPRFGGPEDGADVREVPPAKVWKEGTVRGHVPTGGRGSRGEWDLLGGALRVLLGKRLASYVVGSHRGGKPRGGGDG